MADGYPGTIKTWRSKEPVNKWQDPKAIKPGGDQCWDIEIDPKRPQSLEDKKDSRA